MKTSGCGFVKMEEVGWCLGLSAGSVFLDKNWLIYQIRGPGVKQEEKVCRMGRPRSATPAPSHIASRTLLLFPHKPAFVGRVPTSQLFPSTCRPKGGWLLILRNRFLFPLTPPQGGGWVSRLCSSQGQGQLGPTLDRRLRRERGVFAFP